MRKAVPMSLCMLLLVAAPWTAQADPAALARNCATCHGLTGVSSGDLIPNIAGQNEAYLKRTLANFKADKRHSLFMGRLAKGYDDQELEAVAAHFARAPWTAVAQATEPRLVDRGRELARVRCVSCHGGAGAPTKEAVPLVAGQWAAYLKLELTRFMDPQVRVADPDMRKALAGLADADLEALAQFYASER